VVVALAMMASFIALLALIAWRTGSALLAHIPTRRARSMQSCHMATW
jgi:hypothetical protein